MNQHRQSVRIGGKVKLMRCEKATYIKLRRDFKYTIPMLSKLFGRSTSVIHRLLKNQKLAGKELTGAGFGIRHINNKLDMRCGDQRKHRENFGRLVIAETQEFLDYIASKWLAFASGESDKPP